MAFIRPRRRADGTTGYAVVHKESGRQSSLGTFDDKGAAEEFCAAVNAIGAQKAMLAWGIAPTIQSLKKSTAPTVTDWLQQYIATRTGVTKTTLYDYSSYLRNDITPVIGAIPLDRLTPDDVAAWVQGLAARGLAGKTIANRHGFLSAALKTAVQAEVIPTNPAADTRMPRTERAEMCCLTRDEFNLLLAQFAPHWQPLVRFMVASGARFGEISALRPADVDRTHNTVYIGRGWKRTYDGAGYELGAPKTKRSVRTISVHPALLGDLDYGGEFLFTNTVGKPLRAPGFRSNVWYPAVAKARAAGLAKKPRIHDMRHTCASWMIAGGANMYAVQRHLGHESIQTTISLYTHLDRSDSERAAKIIGDALGI
ncbi:integrase [Mycobacterium phage Squirty]|uniref:Integrase n=1 Tax=Mycobacterium phage Squirty TaxID=1527512 RepID=A0A088F8U2_9CAUD|nr:integrase [Mycobacterium phage Squirty]AIM40982.1 integrase [Mycobacterium phage Squirty]